MLSTSGHPKQLIELLNVAGNHKRHQDVRNRAMHLLHFKKSLKFNWKLSAP